MKITKSQFNRWKAGELTMLGGFQTALFHAFQLADFENQEKLIRAFPYWFLERELNEHNNNNKSIRIGAQLKEVTHELINAIQAYVDEKGSLEFEDTVNLSYADEEMRMIVKEEGETVLVTIDNMTGSEYYTYKLNDQGSISIEDLVWILEQIEIKMGPLL